MARRFPPPWRVEQSWRLRDEGSNGQPLAYVYGRESRADADTAHVLTLDEARRIARQRRKAACLFRN